MKALRALVATAGFAAAFAAQASLVGDTLTFSTYFPTDGTLSSSQSFLVGGGIECSGCPSAGFVLAGQTLDIGADYIEFISGFSTAFSGPDAIFDFTDLDFSGALALSGFTLTTDFGSVSSSDVSFTADSIRINIGSSGTGTTWRLELVTAAVPLPSSLALAGLGLLALGFASRRRAR